MRVRLQRKGKVLWEGQVSKADGVLLDIEDGKAEAQLIFNAKELRVSADGGGGFSTWECDIVVPRVKEAKV